MQQTLFLEYRNVYGNLLIYPVCETSKKLSQLINQKTFTHRDLCILESIGYILNIKD